MAEKSKSNKIKNLGAKAEEWKWKKGETGNPNGRPNGQRNYATLYREALIKLATINGKEPEELEVEMLSNAIARARSGDYKFYKDVIDRIFGTAIIKTELTVEVDQESKEKSKKAVSEYLKK